MIDPRAVIDPKAELDEGVTVGPFSVIGADVQIAAGTTIASHVVIQGPTRIGRDNRLFPFSSLGEAPQDLKYQGEATRLEIGERNTIREYVTIHRGTIQDQGVTRIGNDNLLMAYVHIAHDCRLGNSVILANAASLAGHVTIDDWAILGGFSGVHQFCRIGSHAFVGAGSLLFKDLPPYITIGGTPAAPHGINREGLVRRGFSSEALRNIRQAYKLLYKKGLKLEEAVAAMRQLAEETPEVGIMVDFIAQSQRSIIR